MDSREELRLIRRIADKDRDALSELFLGYHPRLFKFIYRLSDSYTVADELVNDVMLTIWQKAASFRGDSRVSTWIFGIAYRLTMRRVTKKKLQLADIADNEHLAAPDAADLETQNWVHRGLQSLPPAQKMTVILVFYLGLTYEETAEITECPVNTVKTRMFHARRKLKGLLEASASPRKRLDESAHE